MHEQIHRISDAEQTDLIGRPPQLPHPGHRFPVRMKSDSAPRLHDSTLTSDRSPTLRPKHPQPPHAVRPGALHPP